MGATAYRETNLGTFGGARETGHAGYGELPDPRQGGGQHLSWASLLVDGVCPLSPEAV